MTSTKRDIVDHIRRVEREPIEAVLERNLGAKYGERFGEYRRNYHRTLNADADGYFPDFPLTVTIELVNRCNLSCVMCYTANHSLPKETLRLDEVERIFEEVAAQGGPAVLIGMGSEAMVYKDVREVIKAAAANDIMDLFFISNGTLLDAETCELLVTSGVSRVLISLDAATPETFTKIRGKDELANIERNVHTLHAHELPILAAQSRGHHATTLEEFLGDFHGGTPALRNVGLEFEQTQFRAGEPPGQIVAALLEIAIRERRRAILQ